MARLVSCGYCLRVHPVDQDCGRRGRKKEPTQITRLRTCRRWDRTRSAVYERDHFLCRVCFAQGVLESDRLEAHHIVPLAENDQLAYEMENLITLCPRHHKEADRGRIRRERLWALIPRE